ncbi:MFS transporter [Streptomyces sp. NPDC007983]|uniref:MFS transporter n=1 Tax=Streptomyces sp. NPDC007983 TaxID=3364800 RepID=UPI0036E24872
MFLLGSLLSELAWNATGLIVFRVVQGLAGGLMMPLMATLLMQAAQGRAIGKVMAVITVPTALGPILGPVLGGLILHLAGRRLFLADVPFCVVGCRRARRDLPDDRPAPDRPRARLDTVGLLLLCPGCAALVYGLSRVEGSAGFATATVLIPLIGGLALIGGFIARALPRTTGALVDVRPFRHRAVASSSAALPGRHLPVRVDAAPAPVLPAGSRRGCPRLWAAAHPARCRRAPRTRPGRHVHRRVGPRGGRLDGVRLRRRGHRAVRLRHRRHQRNPAHGRAVRPWRRSVRRHDRAHGCRLRRAAAQGDPRRRPATPHSRRPGCAWWRDRMRQTPLPGP